MARANQEPVWASNGSHGGAVASPCAGRVRVAGKAFARGGRPFPVRGVTYGPFAPDADGLAFPSRGRVAQDFRAMRAAGVNAVRTYHVPPDWLLRLADAAGLGVLAGLPWADV